MLKEEEDDQDMHMLMLGFRMNNKFIKDKEDLKFLSN